MPLEMTKSWRLGRNAAIVIGLSVACTAGSLIFIQSQHDETPQHGGGYQHGWSSMTPQVTAAFDAVREDRADDLTHLLEKDPTLINAEAFGSSLMDFAAARGNTDIADVLIKYHADPDAPARNGATPLAFAAFAGSKPMVQWLIAKKVNVESRSRREWTPIFYAASGSSRFDDSNADFIGVCDLLIKAGASADAVDMDGASAAQIASEPVARFLIDHGAKLSVPQHIAPLQPPAD